MSVEYAIGPVTRAENAEARVIELENQLVTLEAETLRLREERNQLLEHMATEIDEEAG